MNEKIETLDKYNFLKINLSVKDLKKIILVYWNEKYDFGEYRTYQRTYEYYINSNHDEQVSIFMINKLSSESYYCKAIVNTIEKLEKENKKSVLLDFKAIELFLYGIVNRRHPVINRFKRIKTRNIRRFIQKTQK